MTGRHQHLDSWSASSAFFDLPAEDRGAAYDAAEARYGMDFWDLDPQERANVYDRALDDYWGAS